MHLRVKTKKNKTNISYVQNYDPASEKGEIKGIVSGISLYFYLYIW